MKLRIEEHAMLGPLTTFQIGGPARWLVEVTTQDDIKEAVAAARKVRMPFVLIAGGSNVLVSDEGFRGLVMRLVGGEHHIEGPLVFADAGCTLDTLIRETAAVSLAGWEKLAGIPGSIGGAVRGNAGAFGVEMKDVVGGVRAYNSETDEVKDFSNKACQFSYRNSFFKEHPEWIITRIVVKLTPGNQAQSERFIKETIAERERRHIQNVRAAGSFFVNPRAPSWVQLRFEREKKTKSKEGRVPAGWLIEKAGHKGTRVGGAKASEQHPNYLTNVSEATAADVLALADEIKQAVHEQFSVRLKEEVSLVGF